MMACLTGPEYKQAERRNAPEGGRFKQDKHGTLPGAPHRQQIGLLFHGICDKQFRHQLPLIKLRQEAHRGGQIMSSAASAHSLNFTARAPA